MSDAHDAGMHELTKRMERSSFEETSQGRPIFGKEYKQAPNEDPFDDNDDNDDKDDYNGDDEDHPSPPNQPDDIFFDDKDKPTPDEHPQTGGDESSHDEEPAKHQQEHRSESEGTKSSKSSKSNTDGSDGTPNHNSPRIKSNIWERLVGRKSRWVHALYNEVGDETRAKRCLFIKVIRSISGGCEPIDCIPIDHIPNNLPEKAIDYSSVLLYTIMSGLLFTEHAPGDEFWTDPSASEKPNILDFAEDEVEGDHDQNKKGDGHGDEADTNADQGKDEEEEQTETEDLGHFFDPDNDEDSDYNDDISSSGENDDEYESRLSDNGEYEDLGSRHSTSDDSEGESEGDVNNPDSGDESEEEEPRIHNSRHAADRTGGRSMGPHSQRSPGTTGLRPTGPPTRASASKPTTVPPAVSGRKRSLHEMSFFSQGRRGSGKRLRMSMNQDSAEDGDGAIEESTEEQRPQPSPQPSGPGPKSILKNPQSDEKSHRKKRFETYGPEDYV